MFIPVCVLPDIGFILCNKQLHGIMCQYMIFYYLICYDIGLYHIIYCLISRYTIVYSFTIYYSILCYCAELRSFRRGWMALRFREDNV